jgi:hypothetical protein
MSVNEIIEPCPRCGSNILIKDIEGNMRSFPMVILSCENKDCLWNMTCLYDELSSPNARESLLSKMIMHWNEGVSKIKNRITTKDLKNVLTKIDEMGGFYTQYTGNSMGRVLHYIYNICGLMYAENVIFKTNGNLDLRNQHFAKVDFSKGFPYFEFVDGYFNKKQDELLKQ